MVGFARPNQSAEARAGLVKRDLIASLVQIVGREEARDAASDDAHFAVFGIERADHMVRLKSFVSGALRASLASKAMQMFLKNGLPASVIRQDFSVSSMRPS